LFVVHALR